jgi:2-polyprenyl-6-methoxyphenol hydroxylase-like FAD-dependent oxidoreductase
MPAKRPSPEIIVVGAGAVGLMLGNLLGQVGLSVLLLEKNTQPRRGSRAIGITPPSLDLLAVLQLDRAFLRAGVRVRHAVLHGKRRALGSLHFDCLRSAHPFILSVPQEEAERLLRENLRRFKSVTLRPGQEAVGVRLKPDGVLLDVRDAAKRRSAVVAAPLVCACDGKNSTLRALLGLDFPGGRYRQTYLMGDFTDQSGLGAEAHFFFTPLGPVESFPLPRGRRRWIVETRTFLEKPAPGFLAREVAARTGFALNPAHQVWESPFGTQRHLLPQYFRERVLFCGDAAHVMSPIGGQGMNTGWGDAEFAARALAQALSRPTERARVFQAYQTYRQKAFRTAARRAAQLMRLGAWKGRLRSGIRNLFIRLVVGLLPRTVAGYFSMQSIPYRNLAQVLEKEPLLFKNHQLDKSEK